MKIEDLKWFVKNWDFNKKELEDFNIFRNWKFIEGVQEAVDKYFTYPETLDEDIYDYDAFKEDIRKELQYCFWSKREYEVFIGDAFETDLSKYEKVDIYSQVLPNLDILCNYILDTIDGVFEEN